MSARTTTNSFSANSGSLRLDGRLAQQSLQADFDPGLVLLFDRQGQGGLAIRTSPPARGWREIDGSAAGRGRPASAIRSASPTSSPAAMPCTSPAPVAVAETVGGADNQQAVVRMRQGGENSLQLTFYRVDDLTGTIDGKAPAMPTMPPRCRRMPTRPPTAGSAITGPGYGQFSQTLLQGIDADDIVAMRLDNLSTGAFYWAFANANERSPASPSGTSGTRG